jgi:trimeric autotransporter adhesin
MDFTSNSKANHRALPTRRKYWRTLSILSVVAVAAAGGIISAVVGTASPSYAVTKTIVQDPMSRVSTSGWGSAPVGGAYSHTAKASFRVTGELGVIDVPGNGTSRTARLSTVATRDTSASVAISTGDLPVSGGGFSTGLQLRATGDSNYRASVRISPTGTANLSITRVNGSTVGQTTLSHFTLPFPVHARQLLLLQFQALGDQDVALAARAWLGGTPRPAWQVTSTDSSLTRLAEPGGVGFWSYVSRNSEPTKVYVDNLTAYELAPTSAVSPTATPSPDPSETSTPTPTPTATAAPSPEPSAPPVTVDPVVHEPSTQGTVGSAQVGTTNYAVPADAIFVSPQGSDQASGSKSAPLGSVGAAISRAASGATIVLRAGTYHQSATIPSGKKLTIQSYPSEAVWFDGSRTVDNWVTDGTIFSAGNWTAQFDASPTFTFGAPDGKADNWSFVNPQYPMAAHPDQVWIDGAAQKQVGSRAEVKAGSFYVDYAADKLYVGTNPAGKTVRASDIAKAISIRGAGSTLRGIGIQRYAPSVPHMGAVTVEVPNVTVENVVVNDTSTTGLFVMQSGVVVRNVTLLRNGMLGSSMSTADDLTVTGMLANGNNTERFNNAPVSGGLKIVRSRGVSVTNSQFADNLGPGLWFDESVYNGTVVGNDIAGNKGHGLILEISAKFDVVDNLIARNTDNGLKLNDTSDASVWNNTFVANGRSLNVVQDTRRASDRSVPGHDPRQAFPDPTMTWINTNAVVRNNVVADARAANCLLCVEDYSKSFTADQLKITSNGNIYQRANLTDPQWTAIWAQGSANPLVFTTLPAFRSATGQAAHSIEVVGQPVTNSDGSLVESLVSRVNEIGQPLPTNIAALAGKTAGLRFVGAWR